MDFTLKQLRYLMAVGGSRSLSLAARQLFISQHALYSAVTCLETTLSIPLPYSEIMPEVCP